MSQPLGASLWLIISLRVEPEGNAAGTAITPNVRAANCIVVNPSDIALLDLTIYSLAMNRMRRKPAPKRAENRSQT